jgi:hypothetical protein
VRYLNDSKRQLFSKFKEAHPGIKMCLATFYNLIPEYYKEPSKATDLCNVCEAGKRDEARLRRMEQQQSGSEASDKQRDAFKRLQRRVDYYRVHKRLVNVQRECYKSEVNSPLVQLSHSRDDDGFPFLIGRGPGSRTGCLDP